MGIRGTCTSYTENPNPNFRENVVPPAKPMGAELLEVAVPEIADVVSGKKNQTAAKSVARHTLKNKWIVVAAKRLRTQSFQRSLRNKPVGHKKFFTNISHYSMQRIFCTMFLRQFPELYGERPSS